MQVFGRMPQLDARLFSKQAGNMYLSELKLWNFRKYGINGESIESSLPGVAIQFHEGMNVLIGENDSGKTAIVDAIRYTLGTQSREWIHLDESDFHVEDEHRAEELKIECIFRGFTDQEAGRFLEWLGNEDVDGVKRYVLKDYKLRGWMEHKGGISTLGSYWLHPKTLKVGKSLDEPISKLGEDTSTYQRINGIRKEVLEGGFLSYNDAYSIALRYLNFVPAIRQAFQDRFCMVFLDEAQDTYEHQFRVLDTLFQPDKLVLQRIGDPNQAIFGPTTGSNMVWSPKSPLHFSDTQRYGDTISRILSSVRLQDDISLRACQSRNSYPPQIIAFLPGEEHQVIRAFVELIHSFELSEDTYYAIGWVGKDNTAKEKLCIPTYFPQFTGFQKSSSKQFSNLISYTAYAIQIAKLECVKCFSEIILQGIAHALNDAGIKTEESNRSYTSHTVKIHWKCQDEEGYNEFRSQIACSYLQALGSHLDAIEFRDSIKAALTSIWPINGEKATFLICDTIDFTNQPDTKEPINQFISDSGIIVNVGTVHSVKGETHAATLYLETDYYGQTDAKRLINFLKGKRNPSELGKERHKENLKIAHVAFSRPKYLLAFACQTSSVAGHKKELKDNGWEIRSVPGLIMGREEIA